MSENVANKDEALKCLGIARRALVEGDTGKADRFAQKALRLYRCQEVEAFLVELSVAGRQNGHAPSSSGTSTPAHHTRSHDHSTAQSTRSSSQQHGEPAANGSAHADGTRQRKHAGTANGTGPQLPKRGSDANGGVSTPEQRALVQKILKAKDFYEILGVDKGAADDDIKRAYRKLALKLHPDKNAAPKAEEAFKAVSRAFSCLSDANKRAYYDRTGYETRDAAAAAASSTPSRRGSAGGFGGGFPGGMYGGGDDFDAEELFNMFFGGSPFNPRAQVYRQHGGAPRRQTHTQQQYTQQAPADQQRNAWAGLLQLLPVLLLLALTFFGGSSEPTYALAREGRFQHQLATQRLQVPFFVKSMKDFERSHPPNSHVRTALERQVENEYYERVTMRCQQERMTQHRLNIWGKRDQAKAMKMPACEELESMNERLGVNRQRQYAY